MELDQQQTIYSSLLLKLDLSTFVCGLGALLVAYLLLKGCYHVYYFIFNVYEYKPLLPYLKEWQRNKLYGRVKRRDGASADAEMPVMTPNGWYYVMNSVELRREEVKHVQMCGLELAVFRDVDGDVHALDAFCPHLGTNMAIGGKVKGSCLECPFHAWKFSGENGKCTDIPGAKKIPDVARTKSWPVVERNLVIMLWYDAEEREPMYVPRECEEIYEQGWVIHGRSEHLVHCHASEIPENGADVGHFNPVHRANAVYGSDLEKINKSSGMVADHMWSEATWKASKEDWYLAHGTLRHDFTLFGRMVPYTDVKTVFEQIGPGVVYLQPHVFGPLLIMMFVVPLDTFKQRVIHLSLGTKTLFGKLQAIAAMRVESCMVERDIVIWNNKIYKTQSVLAATHADELLVKFRRWYSQFYSDNSKETASSKVDLSW